MLIKQPSWKVLDSIELHIFNLEFHIFNLEFHIFNNRLCNVYIFIFDFPQESQTSSDAGAIVGDQQRTNDVISGAESSSSSSDSADEWESEESERSGVEKGSKEMKGGKEGEEEDLGKVTGDIKGGREM